MKDDCVDGLWLANSARNQLKNRGASAIRIGGVTNMNPMFG
jgi:hypothetical protein